MKILTKRVEEPHLITVIKTQFVRGSGTTESPMRMVTQFHAVNGEFLAENDPCIPDMRLDVSSPEAGAE
jgi:hypothetical protein